MISRLQRNHPQIIQNLQKNLDYVDYDYRGIVNGDIKITKGKPLINAYKMWLQSSKSDYIRNYGFGGFFVRNLNEYEFSPSSEERIKEDLIQKTKELFPQINLVMVEVKCMDPKRYWKVHVVVQDDLTGVIGYDGEINIDSNVN